MAPGAIARGALVDPVLVTGAARLGRVDPDQRKAATVLHEALDLAQEMWTRGARDAGQFRKRIAEVVEGEELANLEYVSVAHPETLEEIKRIKGPALVSMAVRIGKTRLIDNMTLGES